MGVVLSGLGVLMVLVGGIWFLVLAFQEDVMWGIGCLLCGIVQIIFLINHIEETWKPFALQVAGIVLCVAGAGICLDELDDRVPTDVVALVASTRGNPTAENQCSLSIEQQRVTGRAGTVLFCAAAM